MKPKQLGNFRIDEDGEIEFYVGWCTLEFVDLENLEKLLEKRKKIKDVK